jgi:hypothetical protein
MSGGGGLIVITSVLLSEFVTFEAVRTTLLNVPVAVGMPLMTPEAGLIVRPGGRFVAAKVAVVALIAVR